MATFVQIEPDAFNQVFAQVTQDQTDTPEAGVVDTTALDLYHHVRRPARGIQIKEDTYATIQVRQSNGIAIPLFDAAASSTTNPSKGQRNSNFMIQTLQEQRIEKQQIILTFGEPYFYFFGEQPRMITVNGILLNTEDFNWRAEWWENYDLYLRGTQCVRMNTRVYLSWDDIVVEGYITQANASEDSANPYFVTFGFQMYLTNYHNISRIGDPNAHWEGKDISLDPTSIDLPGDGGTSSTQLVRQANITNAQLSSGQNANSLFEALRQGQFGAASTQLATVQGQVVNFLDLAGQFISGRNIRVPIGYQGAAAFDQQVQLALASVPGSAQVIEGPSGSQTISFDTGSTLVPDFQAALNSKFGPANVGLPLAANIDEFIARIQQDNTGSAKFNNLFAGQTVEDSDAEEQIDELFQEFGVDTSPPSPVTQSFQQATFSMTTVTAGAAVADSSTLRSTLNSVGTVL